MNVIRLIIGGWLLFFISGIKAQSLSLNIPHLLTVKEREAAENNPGNEVLAKKNKDGKSPYNDAEKIDFNNYPVDSRAYKYYFQAEINEMSVQKRKQLNYLLNDSYEVVNTQKAGCAPVNKKDINVLDYYYNRKKSERTMLTIDEKCGYQIILYSFDEVEKAKSLITE